MIDLDREYPTRVFGEKVHLATDGMRAETLTHEMLNAIFLNMAATSLADPALGKYLPWTLANANRFFRERQHAYFHQDLQRRLNLASQQVPTVAFEGLHGVGKTTIATEIARRLGAPLIKYSGFIEPEEFEKYSITGKVRELYGDELIKAEKHRAGEASWHILQQIYFHTLENALQKGQKAIVADRGPITRMINWDRDPIRRRFPNPFSTYYSSPDMSFHRFGFGDIDHKFIPTDYEVQVPLPFTVFLYHESGPDRPGLSPGKKQSNLRNFRDFYGLSWDLHDVLGEMDKMAYVDVTGKGVDQVADEVVAKIEPVLGKAWGS